MYVWIADSSGACSLYTTLGQYEIMFHVSTMLPFTTNNRQQVCLLHSLLYLCNIVACVTLLNKIKS